MPVSFYVPSALRTFAQGRGRIDIDESPATVAQALESLWAIHPGIRDRVVTEQGELRPHINVFVGEESIRFAAGLSTPVPDGSEITILPAVSGG